MIRDDTYCRCSTGADPVSDPTTLWLALKVIEKRHEDGELVKKSPTGQYSYDYPDKT